MNDKIVITSSAINAIDKAVDEWRRRIVNRCRLIASQNGSLIDEATVEQAHDLLIHDINRRLKDNVDRSAA